MCAAFESIPWFRLHIENEESGLEAPKLHMKSTPTYSVDFSSEDEDMGGKIQTEDVYYLRIGLYAISE